MLRARVDRGSVFESSEFCCVLALRSPFAFAPRRPSPFRCKLCMLSRVLSRVGCRGDDIFSCARKLKKQIKLWTRGGPGVTGVRTGRAGTLERTLHAMLGGQPVRAEFRKTNVYPWSLPILGLLDPRTATYMGVRAPSFRVPVGSGRRILHTLHPSA